MDSRSAATVTIVASYSVDAIRDRSLSYCNVCTCFNADLNSTTSSSFTSPAPVSYSDNNTVTIVIVVVLFVAAVIGAVLYIR